MLLLLLLGLLWRCMMSSYLNKLRACPTRCPPRDVRREGAGGVR